MGTQRGIQMGLQIWSFVDIKNERHIGKTFPHWDLHTNSTSFLAD